jgi:hypothetical protein
VAQRHGARTAPAAPAVLAHRADPDPRVRIAVLRFIGAAHLDGHAPWLVERLTVKDDAEARAAVEALRSLGPGVLEVLLQALHFGKRSTRNAVLPILRDMPVAPETLRRLIDAELDGMRRIAAHSHALARGAVSDLVLQRFRERSAEALHTTLLLLAALRREERIARLCRLLAGAHGPRERAVLIEALESLLPREYASRLLPLVENGTAQHEAVVGADGAPGDDMVPSFEDAVRAGLSDEDPLTRMFLAATVDPRALADPHTLADPRALADREVPARYAETAVVPGAAAPPAVVSGALPPAAATTGRTLAPASDARDETPRGAAMATAGGGPAPAGESGADASRGAATAAVNDSLAPRRDSGDDASRGKPAERGVSVPAVSVPDGSRAGDLERAMLSSVEIVLHLRTLDIFQRLTTRQLTDLAAVVREEQHPAGATIVREGEFDDCMYLIVEGTVRITRQDHVLAERGAKDFFGEMAVIDGETRSATVTAASPIRLLRLDRPDLFAVMDEQPGIAISICQTLTRRVRELLRATESAPVT